jgi:hypothetical protein
MNFVINMHEIMHAPANEITRKGAGFPWEFPYQYIQNEAQHYTKMTAHRVTMCPIIY